MPDQVVAAAAALLAAKTLAGVGGEAGKSLWSGLGRLVSAVRQKLSGDSEATARLERVLAGGGSLADVQALTAALELRLRADPSFRQEVSELVAQARQDDATAQFLTLVTAGGRVGKIANFGRVEGDVHL